MTPAPQPLSARSLDRYRSAFAQIIPRLGAAWAAKEVVKTGIVDRKNRNALATLEMADGLIVPTTSQMFDLIFVEQPQAGDRNEPDFARMKARLDVDGVILLKRNSRQPLPRARRLG